MSISHTVRLQVRNRAANLCEYCGLAQSSFPLVTFHVEHVIARQHGGSDNIENLCLACHWCNLFKGPNLSALVDGELTRLFNPRIDEWNDHFRIDKGVVHGVTPIGIGTVQLLNMNDADRIELRRIDS